jgi:hypothetical protein
MLRQRAPPEGESSSEKLLIESHYEKFQSSIDRPGSKEELDVKGSSALASQILKAVLLSAYFWSSTIW